jgi:hypothetical protein
MATSFQSFHSRGRRQVRIYWIVEIVVGVVVADAWRLKTLIRRPSAMRERCFSQGDRQLSFRSSASDAPTLRNMEHRIRLLCDRDHGVAFSFDAKC